MGQTKMQDYQHVRRESANDTAMPDCANPSDDFRAELLWQRRKELNAIANRVSETATDDATEAALEPVFACDHLFEADMSRCVAATACVLMVEIENDTPEEVAGLFRACLKAILPQLEGSIGADAERLLAKEEEEEMRQ